MRHALSGILSSALLGHPKAMKHPEARRFDAV